MDHLPAPEGTETGVDVPYVGTREYDGGDFRTYPQRMKWTESDLKGVRNFGNRSAAEVESFFQTWLYFGSLISVLAHANIKTSTQYFIRQSSGPTAGKYVSTKWLPQLLHQWRENEDNDKKDSRAEAIKKILDEVRSYANRYCAEKSNDPNISRSPISSPISMSIIALVFTLYQCANNIYGPPVFLVYLELEWPFSVAIKERLAAKKWCPRDIAQFREELSIDCQYYLSCRWSPRKDQNHSKCTEGICVGGNIDTKTYQTRHFITTCHPGDCHQPLPNVKEIVDIIGRGQIPLVRWRPEDNKIEIIEYKPESKITFVCISHIWADGMGNEVQNSLPQCQLNRIQNMVNGVYNINGECSVETPVAFWMDTLCIPVPEEYKKYRKLAIGQMAQVYKDADTVLVLDSWLQGISVNSNVTEKSVRLYVANWQRRLWTLQEGVFAKKLFMQFSDGAQNMRDTYADLPTTGKKTGYDFYSAVAGTCSALMTAPYTSLNDMLELEVDTPEAEQMVNKFPWYIAEARNRATTRMSDETICLSTLLGVSLSELFKAPDGEGERMMKFLTLVKYFDRKIIFNTHPRIQRSGFGWAPVSYMDRSQEFFPSGAIPVQENHLDDVEPYATIKTTGGLQLNYAGIALDSIKTDLGTTFTVVLKDSPETPKSIRGFKVWLQEDEVVHWSPWDAKLEYAIILYPYWQYASAGEPSAAVLGIQEEQPDAAGEIKFRHLARTWVLPLPKEKETPGGSAKKTTRYLANYAAKALNIAQDQLEAKTSPERLQRTKKAVGFLSTQTTKFLGTEDKPGEHFISGLWLGDHQMWCIV